MMPYSIMVSLTCIYPDTTYRFSWLSMSTHGYNSTFEFPSRVNLSGPSLYCIGQTLGKKADTQ